MLINHPKFTIPGPYRDEINELLKNAEVTYNSSRYGSNNKYFAGQRGNISLSTAIDYTDIKITKINITNTKLMELLK